MVSEKTRVSLSGKESKMDFATKKALKITVIYFLFGCIWIISTDMIAAYFITNPDIVISILKGVFYVAVTAILINRLIYPPLDKLSRSEAKLKESESLFRTVFEQAPIGIAIINDCDFLSDVNTEFSRILGRPESEILSLSWVDITHPDDLHRDMEEFKRFKSGEISGYALEKRFLKPDGTFIWIDMVIANIYLSGKGAQERNHLCIIQDIHNRKIAEEALRESERSKTMLLSNLLGMAYRCIYDKEWTMQFLSEGCHELTGYEPKSLLHNKELSYNDLIVPEWRGILWDEWERVLNLRIPFRYEYEIITAQKERKWVLEVGQGVFRDDGTVEALEGIIVDVTEAKKRAEQIEYIDVHDFMTGLYNRRYYEMEKLRLADKKYSPVSVLKADINGVKLINDAFGYMEGDRIIAETARVIQSCCRKGDLVARIGGDEFGIFLPNTSCEEAYELSGIIKEACERHNQHVANVEQSISLSIGIGFVENGESLDNAEKQAEEDLRKSKLFEQRSHHSAILSSIMATMFAKSHETEEHAQRIAEICKLIGEKINLTQHDMDELQLFSMIHDLGKVGIDDRILRKPEKLTDAEWVIMKTHPEIGYRIAMTVPEMQSVAGYILSHHERWDGKGYPQGKCGEEIPLLSRILEVADAYDAMTEDRVYRKAMSQSLALEEIEKNAGLQFDPDIARIFVETMRGSS